MINYKIWKYKARKRMCKYTSVFLLILSMFSCYQEVNYADTYTKPPVFNIGDKSDEDLSELSLDNLLIQLESKVKLAEGYRASNQLIVGLFSDIAALITQIESKVIETNISPSDTMRALIVRAYKVADGVNGSEADELLSAVQKAYASFKMTEPLEEKPVIITVLLTDIDEHWGNYYIKRLVGIGAIKGYADGTFKPDKTITRAEFLSIAMIATTKDVTSYPKTSDHWASQVLEAAYAQSIIKPSEISQTSSSLDKAITRQEMAMIMVRINELIQHEEKVSTLGANTIIADFSTLSVTYKEYVKQAYFKGFISGVDNIGTFAGEKLGTRAQAATMLIRLLENGLRKLPEIDASKSIIAPERAPITIYEGETNRELLPQAGDTFVKKDGTKVIITSIIYQGYEIVGYGQGLDLYTGMSYSQDGSVSFTAGKNGAMWEMSLRYMGQPYLVDSKTGEGHFKNDWVLISAKLQEEVQAKIKKPNAGQIYNNWFRYEAEIGMWSWIGPVR